MTERAAVSKAPTVFSPIRPQSVDTLYNFMVNSPLGCLAKKVAGSRKVLAITADKRYQAGFAWFDYIRPKDKDDIFDWRSKSKDKILKKTEKRVVPKQRLEDL